MDATFKAAALANLKLLPKKASIWIVTLISAIGAWFFAHDDAGRAALIHQLPVPAAWLPLLGLVATYAGAIYPQFIKAMPMLGGVAGQLEGMVAEAVENAFASRAGITASPTSVATPAVIVTDAAATPLPTIPAPVPAARAAVPSVTPELLEALAAALLPKLFPTPAYAAPAALNVAPAVAPAVVATPAMIVTDPAAVAPASTLAPAVASDGLRKR